MKKTSITAKSIISCVDHLLHIVLNTVTISHKSPTLKTVWREEVLEIQGGSEPLGLQSGAAFPPYNAWRSL